MWGIRGAGFTLVEVIMVIVILGLLAISAVPAFFDMRASAVSAAMDGVVANVQSGISTWHYNKLLDNSDTYPYNLDTLANNTICSSTSGCFTTVLKTPVTSSRWKKRRADHFHFDVGGNGAHEDTGDYHWEIDTATGVFTGWPRI